MTTKWRGTVRPLIVGNWKMNGLVDDGRDLAAGIGRLARARAPLPADVMVCPPFPLLPIIADALGEAPISLGAQDCHQADRGAHTGDVSARLLADLGCAAVILGHSERRSDHHEVDLLVSEKAAAARAAGLTAIVCVGESEAERDAGAALDVVSRQLAGSLPAQCGGAEVIIAYEPVWAIGTGRTPTAEQIHAMHSHIRAELARLRHAAATIRILYGGSVRAGNAADLLSVPNVNGALVGGASLDPEGFLAIALDAG